MTTSSLLESGANEEMMRAWGRKRWACVLVLLAAAYPRHGMAQALDPAAAREHLLQGYRQKQQGDCRRAVEHFNESVRLDPQLKALINLADCEEQLGRLVDAQRHWLQARDRAQRDGDIGVRQEAEKRLKALEARMPRLTIQLAPGTPADAAVYRDEVLLGQVSLATPLPTDPGEHSVVVKAPGFEDRVYKVTLSEGSAQTLTVSVGPERIDTPPAAASSGLAREPIAESAPTPTRETPPQVNATGGGLSTQQTLGIVVGAGGIASFGLAGFFWLQADKTLDNENDPRRKDNARVDLRVATIASVAGGVLTAGGVVLFLTAPKERKTSGTWWQPSLALRAGSVTFGATGIF